MKLPLILTAMLTVFVLSGCGQKGPLYLPQTAKSATASEK
ncbi:MAG: lipoprotein [Legionella sp.]